MDVGACAFTMDGTQVAGKVPPYDGPFCVLERGSKNFMLEQGVGVVNMAHLVANEVPLLVQVPLRGHPPSKAGN